MIYDGHAYCIPDLRGNGGFADAEQFRRHLQLAIATHFQPVWRAADRSPADASGLAEPVGDWSFDSLKEADFRVAGYGRFEWTVDGEDYVKQYMPPSVRNMAYSAEDLVAEMDYAGVDMALLHRTPYLGVGNDFIAECCRKFPDRIQGLAHVEEWTVRTDTGGAIRKLQEAIGEQGLHGLQILPDHLPLYGQPEEWDTDDFTPFWDAFAELDVPLFVTPGYTALASAGVTAAEPVVTRIRTIRNWMERYPDVPVVLTHGLGWRLFIADDRLAIPDEVFDSIPDNPNFYIQVMFAIALGGVWDYPMEQVRPTMEALVDRVGAGRLIWAPTYPW